MARFWQRLGIFALSVLMSSNMVVSAYAFDADLYYNNGIIFYDGSECQETDCVSSNGSNITFIGDTIGEGLKTKMSETFSNLSVDDNTIYEASANRTWAEGLEALKKLTLREIVIFELGTYTTDLTQSDLDDLFDAVGVGADKTVVLITNYSNNGSDYTNNNDLFETNSSKENVILVDWATEAAANVDTWLADETTPTDEGYAALAELIYDALNTCSSGSSSSGSVTSGDNTDYAGNQIWTDDELAKIEEYQPLYEEAANAVGIPWQILAVLHYREHRLGRDNPSNGQGIFQLYGYTAGGTNSNAFTASGDVSDDEFVRQATLAAEEILGKVPELASDPSDDNVKLAFFRYNGTAQAYISQARDLGFSEEEANIGEGSPYVMNKADAQRDPNSNPNGWGQIKTDGGSISYPANQDYGAYVLYAAIGGGTGSSCSSGGNGDIASTAWDLAWHEGESGFDGLDPNSAYKTALSEVGLTTYGDQWVQIGASCDAFVTTVYRYSETDPDFSCCGTGSQLSWLASNDNYELIASDSSDTSILESGDILILDGHIKLYIEHEGTGYEAQASYGDHSGQTTQGVALIDSIGRGYYQVYRHK